MKRILFAALLLCMLTGLLAAMPITAGAAGSGVCGSSLAWALDDNGTLTISGTGEMNDFGDSIGTSAPWLLLDFDVTYQEVTMADGHTYQCNTTIKNVVIEDGITSIGELAFAWCSSLTSITIPDSITSIHTGAFAWCPNLTNVTLQSGVTAICKGAFYECDSLASVTISSSVTSIDSLAFYNCRSLSDITVAFDNPYYASVDGNLFNKNKTKLLQYATGKSDTAYTIPDGVTSIGEYAFNCRSLTSVTIPDGVTSIGKGAFTYCFNLTSVTIPDSVTFIGEYAFYGFHAHGTPVDYIGYLNGNVLTDVYYGGNQEQWNMIYISKAGNEELFFVTIHYNAIIHVLVNNTPVQFDQPPVLIEDRVLVPVRAIFEALGAEVQWNDDTQTAIAVKGGTTVQITIDNNAMLVNGEVKLLDVPAQLMNNRTLVPLRAVSEAFACNVAWNDGNQTAMITE